MIKVFDSLTDTSPTVFADLNVNVHFTGIGNACSAWRSRRTSPRPVRLCPLHLRPRARLHRTRAALGNAECTPDPCPTPPGATADGCVVRWPPVQLHSLRKRDDRQRAGPHRGLGTSNTRATRSVRWSSAVMAPCTPVGRRRQQLCRQARTDLHSTHGGHCCAAGATLTPPTAEGGALRSQDLRTSGDPVGLDG